MISYTMVGTNDLEHSVRFYDPLFAQMGLEQCFRDDNCVFWGKKSDIAFPRFFTGYPFDGEKANAGNGVMTAFVLENSAMIDRLYAIAMREGGSDDGEPGFRPQYGRPAFLAPMSGLWRCWEKVLMSILRFIYLAQKPKP